MRNSITNEITEYLARCYMTNCRKFEKKEKGFVKKSKFPPIERYAT